MLNVILTHMFIVIDEFRKVKESEHYETINSVGKHNNVSEATTNQPSTSGSKQSPVKSASFSGVLVNNKQVYSYYLVDIF